MRARPKQKLRNGVTQEGALYSLFCQYKRTASKKEHAFELTINQARALFFGNCHYCGIPPQQIFRGILYNGIDRVDNSLGYLDSNTVSACGFCNYAKRGNSVQQFYVWIERVAQHHGKREKAPEQVCGTTSQETDEGNNPGAKSYTDPTYDTPRTSGVL